jgi:hypothetical protein
MTIDAEASSRVSEAIVYISQCWKPSSTETLGKEGWFQVLAPISVEGEHPVEIFST